MHVDYMNIYLVVTPENSWITDGSNDMWYYAKFGITKNSEYHTVRSGYTTHNPSIAFTKQEYNKNIRNVLGHTDLGKFFRNILLEKEFIAVVKTEWVNGSNIQMIKNIFKWFAAIDAIIDETNVKNYCNYLKSIPGQ